MLHTYKAFSVEVGFSGNILSHSFEIAGCLTTDETWFKNLWEFASYLDVGIELSVEHHIQPVREGDRSFMGGLLEEGFEGKTAERLNRVRKYKSLIHFSDGARSDGHTLDPAILTDEPGEPSTVTFPLERPTKADFQLWAECLKSITIHSLQLLV